MSQEVQKEVKSPVMVRKIQKGMGEKKKKSMKSQIFLYLSPKKRSKGLSLLRHLENNENLSWDKKGEIIYKGKLIPNSNILTLINHTIHDNDTSEPIGMKSFYKVLENSNVLRILIENKKGKHLVIVCPLVWLGLTILKFSYSLVRHCKLLCTRLIM